MSRRISDAQIYGLMWAESNSYGMFSELHDPPGCVMAPDRRVVMLLRTAFDRLKLLGLARRGLLRDAGNGLWSITGAGRAELKKPAILARITQLADETAKYNARPRDD